MTKRPLLKCALTTAAALSITSGPATAPAAAEVVLKGVSSFQEGAVYSRKFESFIKQVNEKGKGSIRIQYLGGAPKVMPTFDVGKNLRDGIVDIGGFAAAFYTNVMPEADALKLIEVPMSELRKNGGWELINKIHNEKMNAYYLARTDQHDVYHLYVNKPLTKPDFAGFKLRVTPVYRAMIEKLGGTAITSPPADVYTLLERNTVDGYGWPARGIFDFSWQKVTKYRIDPGFYRTDTGIVVNLNAWTKKLDDAQRKLLTDIALEIENAPDDRGDDAERKRQEEAGVKVIQFTGEDAKKYLDAARDAGWEGVLKVSPQYGPQLRQFLAKKD